MVLSQIFGIDTIERKQITFKILSNSDCICFIDALHSATGISRSVLFKSFSKIQLYLAPKKIITLFSGWRPHIDPRKIEYNFEYIHRKTESILKEYGFDYVVDLELGINEEIPDFIKSEYCVVLHDGPLGPLTHYRFLYRGEVDNYLEWAKDCAERHHFQLKNIKLYFKRRS